MLKSWRDLIKFVRTSMRRQKTLQQFDKAYFDQAAAESLKWVEERIADVSSAYTNTLVTPGNSEIVKATLDLLYNNLKEIKVPDLDPLD
ncbi:hypothetical protein AbraIFM66950_001144 [Aspergillus brasiliensis]|nr:hypothetical protein AbraIFM66950_001144 [Aspergillus brasiliensis]